MNWILVIMVVSLQGTPTFTYGGPFESLDLCAAAIETTTKMIPPETREKVDATCVQQSEVKIPAQ